MQKPVLDIVHSHNVTEKLSAPYNPIDWKKAIQLLIDDIQLRKQIGKTAYDYAEKKHLINGEIVESYKVMIPLIPVKN